MADLIPLEEFMGGAPQGAGGLVPLEEFQAQPSLQFTGTTGRSATNNNPLNLTAAPYFEQKYGATLEPVSKSGQQKFLKFKSMEDGYNAGLDQIRIDAGRGHTLESFVHKFSPANENPTAELVTSYAKELGVDPTTPLAQIPPEKLIVPMLARESSTRLVGPRENFLSVAGGADVGPGLYQEPEAAPAGPRPPGIYAEPRSLLDTVKDYLGYQDLPAFLPVFNRDNGMWQAKKTSEIRRLFKGWDDGNDIEMVLQRAVMRNAQTDISGVPGMEAETFGWGELGPVTTEPDRMMLQGLKGLTWGVSSEIEKKIYGEASQPETWWGAVGGGALEFAGFMSSPLPFAKYIMGSRLAPTRSGLRGMAQLMAQGGVTLGMATGLSRILPSLTENETLSEAGYSFAKSTASGALVGMLFPVLGADQGAKLGWQALKEAPLATAGAAGNKAVRMAASLAALDFVHTRMQAAPDQGWFSLDDVLRGVQDGSIDRKVLAQKTFDYLLDLYFIARTPTLRKSMEGLKLNALKTEAARVNPEEAEAALVEIGKIGILQPSFKYQTYPLKGTPVYEAEFVRKVKQVMPEAVDADVKALLGKIPKLAESIGQMDREFIGKLLAEGKEPGAAKEEPPSPQPSPTRGGKVIPPSPPLEKGGVEGPQAGKPVPPAEGTWRRPWELSGEEYGARVRALTPEGQAEPSAEKIARRREQDVRQALKRGEAVPAAVLAELPGLAGLKQGPGARGQGPEEGAAPEDIRNRLQELVQKAPMPEFRVFKQGKRYVVKTESSEITFDSLDQANKYAEAALTNPESIRLFKEKWALTELQKERAKHGEGKKPPSPQPSPAGGEDGGQGRPPHRDPWQEALDRQGELLKEVEGKLGRVKTDKSREKLALQKEGIQEEIKRLEVERDKDKVNQTRIREKLAARGEGKGPQAGKPGPAEAAGAGPEAPDYAYIEKGDLIRDRANPEAAGAVVREATQGQGAEAVSGFVVEKDGVERFIPREQAEVMDLEAQEQLMYGGGPGTGEVVAYGRKVVNLGSKLIDWFDKRLERRLPPELKDKDAGKILGSLILKFQQFEDIGRTYPEAAPVFEAARAGLALKTRHAQEFYALIAPYLQLNPAERRGVDQVLFNLDRLNPAEWGMEFRLRSLDSFQSYLVNPRPDLKDKGTRAYMQLSGGLEDPSGLADGPRLPVLSERMGEAAFGVRMALDYSRHLLMDWQTRTFQEWLGGQGLEAKRIQEVMDWVLNTDAPADKLAEAIFGPAVPKQSAHILETFRDHMQYWLKETNQYVPHSRYGEYFIRVIDRRVDTPLKQAAAKFLEAAREFFPNGLTDAKNSEVWRDENGKVAVPKELQAAYKAFRQAIPIKKKNDRIQPKPWGERLVAEAMGLTNQIVYAAAAESRAQYHKLRAQIEAQFPATDGFVIKDKLEKRLPMEMFAETHIPRVWRIISEAKEARGMPPEAGEAMMEAWQDFLAAKGFGAHYIKRMNIPGYETDLLRPLTDYLGGLAGYIGKMEKIRGYAEAFQQVPTEMPNLLRHLNEYANYTLSNPYEYEGLRNIIYHWALGGSLSFHFINALQNVATGWPVLGQVSKGPMKELAGSYKDWARYMSTGEGLRPGEEAVLQRARLEPELAPSGVGELSGNAYNPLYRWLHNDPTSLANRGMDVVKGIWSGSFVEQLNRETFFLAAYRSTGDLGQAIDLTRQAHFLYGKETRPSFARGAGSLPFIFMTYMVNYLTLMKNFGKAALGTNPEVYGTRTQGAQGFARMIAGAMITGGMGGVPLIWPILKAAWTQVFGSELEEDGKQYLQEDLGVSQGKSEFATRLLFRGLPAAALGIDISARVAPNLPFSNLGGGEVRWQDLVAGALGASTMLLQKGWQAGAAINRGDYGRAAEAAAPVSLQNLLAAVRMGREGPTTMQGRPLFTQAGEALELSGGELARKAMGFQPIRVAERSSHERFTREMERSRRQKVQDFAATLARAIREEDDAGFQSGIEAWVAYNNKMLEAGRYADVIEPQTVEGAILSRFKPKFPDVSEKRMLLREMGRSSLSEALSPEGEPR